MLLSLIVTCVVVGVGLLGSCGLWLVSLGAGGVLMRPEGMMEPFSIGMVVLVW